MVVDLKFYLRALSHWRCSNVENDFHVTLDFKEYLNLTTQKKSGANSQQQPKSRNHIIQKLESRQEAKEYDLNRNCILAPKSHFLVPKYSNGSGNNSFSIGLSHLKYSMSVCIYLKMGQ